MELRDIVDAKLNSSSKCYGHCDQLANLKYVDVDDRLLGCYVCNAGYVSRIVLYDKQLDLDWFKNFVADILNGTADVSDQDIRVATRHPWELGLEDAISDEVVLREAYWTQNYRRTKSDDPNRQALFRCVRCGSFFTQALNSGGALCSKCVRLA
jgi:hypothetical protein